MTISIAPPVLADGVDLTATIAGFIPGEGLRRFNYNIFGRGRMVEYSGEFRRADGRGRFTWIVAPSTSIYDPSWGRPALCVVGQRSLRLACASFSVASEPTTVSASATVPRAQKTTATSAAPAKSSSSTTSASATRETPTKPSKNEKCIDAGFSIICSS